MSKISESVRLIDFLGFSTPTATGEWSALGAGAGGQFLGWGGTQAKKAGRRPLVYTLRQPGKHQECQIWREPGRVGALTFGGRCGAQPFVPSSWIEVGENYTLSACAKNKRLTLPCCYSVG